MSATGTLISVATFAGIFALLAIGLNVKFGTTGILDFGHVAVYLVGAYVTAILVLPPASEFQFQTYVLGLDLPGRFVEAVQAVTGAEIALVGGIGWLVAIAIGAMAAAFLGMVVALPAIRLRADYLAIALLGVSVILQRGIQSPPRDLPLVNGPDSLRGYGRPLNDLFPLPGDDVSAVILLGLVVLAVWLVLLWLLVRERELTPGGLLESRIVGALLALTTLGIGYVAVVRSQSRRQRSSRSSPIGPQVYPRAYLPVLGASAAFGTLAALGALVGVGSEALLVFLGAPSAASWVVAWTKIRNHYGGYTIKSGLAGLGIALGVVVALAPAYLLGADGGQIAWVASVATFALIGLLIFGMTRLSTVLEQRDIPGEPLGIVGIGILWLLALRYFVVSLDGAGSLTGILESTRANLVWLVEFEDALAVTLNYRRFLLIMVLVAVAGTFVLMQIVLRSPHGRVLKAVRDDENVAQALGKNAFMFKVQSMALGGAIGGLAGAFWAINARALTPLMFRPEITFFIFLAVILGGKGNNKGVILGAGSYWLFVRGTNELATYFPDELGSRITILRNAIIGLMIILLLYYRPSGIWREEPSRYEVTDA